MSSSLIARLGRAARHRRGGRSALESHSLLGRPVLFHPGCFPEATDYDDAWFLRCCLEAEHVYDVGANVGLKAVVAAIVDTVKTITLIEANPKAMLMAAEHLISNDLVDRCRFVRKIVAERAGETLRFWTTGVDAASSLYEGHAHTARSRGSWIDVQSTTLDRLAADNGTPPDFIKIDVEGAESRVLEGARVVALERRPRLLVEMHSNAQIEMHKNGERILAWCASVRYRAWYLSRRTELCEAAQIARRGRCHLLLQSADMAPPVDLMEIPQGAPLEAALPASEWSRRIRLADSG